MLFVICWLLMIVRCVFVCMLFVVCCCSFSVVIELLFVVCSLLMCVRCVLFVGRCSLRVEVVCSLLFVDR